jgi:hypothetical protein
VWERTWRERDGEFVLLGVAEDAQSWRVAAAVEERGATFPVLIDGASALARTLGFRLVPAGIFVDASGTVRYRNADDFDVADPRVRASLERFLAGEPVEAPEQEEPMSPEALERFAEGVARHEAGSPSEALRIWREALALDPDNFLIRSQIWVAEHPERFYPAVDRRWQELQLLKEGYDKPLP